MISGITSGTSKQRLATRFPKIDEGSAQAQHGQMIDHRITCPLRRAILRYLIQNGLTASPDISMEEHPSDPALVLEMCGS